MGSPVSYKNGQWKIPDNPQIGYITGDGIGSDITPVAIKVIDAAVKKAYCGERSIDWQEVIMGEAAKKRYNKLMPEEESKKIPELKILLKGPLTTPVGGGFRSLNVTLRQNFDLYSCIRPVKYYDGLPSPMKDPSKVDIVIFRENTEDVYTGIEWPAHSKEADEVIQFVREHGKMIRSGSGIGIKPVSKEGSQRLTRAAMKYAIKNKRRSVTIVHKGNIMKFTEGAFKKWAYELIREEFSRYVIFEEDIGDPSDLNPPDMKEKILVKDRIADSIFQQLLLRPSEYDILLTMNLNGDYLSDAAAAQVGGLGAAPGANIGEGIAIFEATHGTAPKYTGLNKVNPGSMILSGVMMLEHMGWQEAADEIIKGFKHTLAQKRVTYDLARQLEGSTLLSCSEFGDAIIENMQ